MINELVSKHDIPVSGIDLRLSSFDRAINNIAIKKNGVNYGSISYFVKDIDYFFNNIEKAKQRDKVDTIFQKRGRDWGFSWFLRQPSSRQQQVNKGTAEKIVREVKPEKRKWLPFVELILLTRPFLKFFDFGYVESPFLPIALILFLSFLVSLPIIILYALVISFTPPALVQLTALTTTLFLIYLVFRFYKYLFLGR